MATAEFALPDLGEGLTEGEILQWLVAPGDVVTINQPVVEVETAKAAVELPSPFAGVVLDLLAEAGATVDVGRVIIRFQVDGAEEPPVAPAADLVPTPPAAREAVLVGYGVKTGVSVRRRPRAGAPASVEAPIEASPVVAPARVSAAAVAEAAQEQLTESAPPVHALAKPPVRLLARERGVDLRLIVGTGPKGVITRADVEAASVNVPASATAPIVKVAGGERRIPIKGVRKATAAAMVASAFTAPHVTLFLTVDVTETMALVTRWRADAAFADVRVTPLLLVARSLLTACRRHPDINASWDEAAQEIVVHAGVNLGIAAATPRGLMVPNIKGADRLSIIELAAALGELIATARAGKTAPAEMSGGTITITNVGSFGVDNGTPILNPGEAAILCFGAVRDQPWVHEGAIAIRSVTQLTLSFDHRLVDGQLGAEVLADVGAGLGDPTRLLAWS